MSHEYRFYMPALPRDAAEIVLEGPEGHHAARVVRVQQGEVVSLFDGKGCLVTGEAVEVGKRTVTVRVAGTEIVAPPEPPLILVQAWLHREKALEQLLRRGTELGVCRFVLYRGDHSVRTPKYHDKWERLFVECCKQCGRLWLPECVIAENLGAALEDVTGTLLLATADEAPQPLSDAILDQETTLLIGPEGDFSEAERQLALERGAQPVSLGDTIFRAEIAGTVLSTLVQYERGKLGPLNKV